MDRRADWIIRIIRNYFYAILSNVYTSQRKCFQSKYLQPFLFTLRILKSMPNFTSPASPPSMKRFRNEKLRAMASPCY